MNRRLIPVILVVAAGVASGFWLFGRERPAVAPAPDESPLKVTQISPEPSIGDFVPAEIGKQLEFVYDLRNSGKETFSGLRLDHLCNCKVNQAPAEELAPGATTRIAVEFTPKTFGAIAVPISVIADGRPAPLLVLRPSVKVAIVAPMLLHGPGSALVTGTGDGPLGELQLDTIERTDSEPWIVGMEASADGRVEVVAEPHRERGYLDPELCLRTYRFVLSATGFARGTHRAVLAPIVTPGAAESLPPIQLEIRIIEPLAFAPDQLKIVVPNETSRKTQVGVFALRAGGAIEAIEFDHELFDVRRVGNQGPGAQAFEVEVRATPSVPVDTKITFAIDGKRAQDLAVRIEPAPVEN